MKALLSAILSSIILLTACYDSHSTPELSDNKQSATVTIAELYNMCGRDILIPQVDISIRGTVISSDSQSYISRGIYIYDGTAAAKICINMSQTSSIYPEGSTIAVQLKGLALIESDYQLLIGMKDNDNPLEIRGIASEVLLDRYISRESTIQTLTPRAVQPSELSSLLCGELVQLEGMTHTPTDLLDTNIAGGFHRFCNRYGDHTYIYIDPYSAGAGRPLPSGEITLTGIVTWHSNIYGELNTIALLPRYSSDIGIK